MSQIKTTELEGDVSVGRHFTAGGNATVRGNATVAKNLKVEGWLDARNIKGPNKGIFLDVTKLREAYPLPHDGWWALVGNTLPAPLYIADGGAWVNTGETAGNPTIDSQQYNEAVAELDADLKSLATEVSGNKADIKSIRTQIDTISGTINTHTSDISGLKTRVGNVESNIGSLASEVSAFKGTRGAADGLAPLGHDRKIPNQFLPGYVDDVIEFNAMVDGVTLQTGETQAKSTDAGCMVVYDKTLNTFLLAVSKTGYSGVDWGTIIRPGFLMKTQQSIEPLALEVSTGSANRFDATKIDSSFWEVEENGFGVALKVDVFYYYTKWYDGASFGTESDNGSVPESGKVYICTSDNKTFRWSGSALVGIGSDLALGYTANTAYPGDEGAELEERLDNVETNLDILSYRTHRIAIVPFNGFYDDNPDQSVGVWFRKNDSNHGGNSYMWANEWPEGYSSGDYNTTFHGFTVIRDDVIFRCGNELYRYDGKGLAKLGGASVGNTYNLTNEVPLSDPNKLFYSIDSADDQYNAPKVVYAQGKASLGMQITFAIAQGSWKTYQYVGTSLEPTAGAFFNPDNWIDLAGMSAGSEPFINVNTLCDDVEYTLSTAIKAVQDKEAATGIKYFKSGVVLTYKTAEKDTKGAPVWETFQFTRDVADINPADTKPWVAFGGGGKNEVETKDEPQAGGKDALSTGGAYKYLPTKNKVTQEDGTVTIQLRNEAEEDVGEPITFFASQGGGGEVSGTIVSITFKDSPLYGAVGKDIVGWACIRSITKVGDKDETNTIATLRLVDRDTNVVVKEWTVNSRSSDEDEYNFEVAFNGMFDGAGQRRFRLEAVDDTDHSGQRNIQVTAIDATIESTQVLNYTSDYVIPYGGTKAVNIPLYKFPQNVSEKGIQAFIEVWWNGAWKPLTATPPTHYDAYSNSAQFNPTNLFGGGEKMQHGAYPIRIHGRDVASGVEGNTIYTAVMCIDPNSTVPVVALRYNDTSEGIVRLYDRIKVEVAAYNPDPKVLTTPVVVKADERILGRYELGASQIETAEMQISGYKNDGSDKLRIVAEAYRGDATLARSGEVTLTVKGSAIDASLMDGALYSFDFSGRSNNEPTHEIVDGDFKIELTGANWSTNGFDNYLGQNCMRIAENVKGRLNHAPFASRTIEATGMVWQAMFATNNIKEADAMLLSCIDPDSGAGFYIKGNKVGLTCKSGSPALIERRFPCGEIHTVAVVVEPSTISINRSGTEWATMRLYMDGELIGAIGYNPGGSRLLNTRYIEMDGTEGDLYMYYILGYQTYYDWSQAFRNYVVKLPDTTAMITEYNRENVLVSQNAEGSTSMRPSAPLLFAGGMPYCVFVCDDETHNQFDLGKGEGDDGTSTSDKFKMTVYYYHPTMPWRSFKAVNCEIRRQGTTSAKRPKKNYRIYIKKCDIIMALYPDYTNEDALTTYALFALKKVRVTENSIPVDVITIKVDYSNSGGANDCSVCDMVNATYRALGSDFLTPAQRCYDGTWDKGDVHLTGLEMNHSTANHPIAVFRSNSDTLQNVWFESKGNWKEDKGEQIALGFKDVPGYNKGCLNFQDEVFNWVCGNPGETLDQMEARFKTMENLDTSMPYLLMPYCSRNYRFMRYQSGQWKNTTGSWTWNGNKPNIQGDVLNPVGGFELLTYEALDWWKGVASVEDMMRPSKNIAKWVQKLIDDKPKLGVTGEEFPAWTYYFECMVDNDSLQADLAMGRIVPFELYVQLRFCDYCDYDKYPAQWVERWASHAYKFRNIRADMVYLADADYQNEFDSLSKNHQPMHFLLEGHNVIGGVYDPDKEGATSPTGFNCEFVLTRQPMIQQANKKYDIDGAYLSDNDGGDTGQPEADPTKPSNKEEGYANPWAGWGAIPWRGYFASKEQEKPMVVDDNGAQIEYQKTVAAMRSVQVTLSDGRTINPFSPEGAKYYFIDQHLNKWAKVVSSYDGIRKYIQYTATSDALYFYALQGLGLAALAQFIEQRWRFRDGFYKTGGFFSGVISGRIACGDDAYIRIVAAKSGYFGMGNDSSGSLSADGAVYLEEGEEYIFRNFSHQQGALLYIYQSDRIREIEFKGVSLSDNFDFSKMTLAERIIVGGEDYVQYNIGYNPLTQYKLSKLPFLRELDIRNTPAANVDASGCPRMEKLLAGGTQIEEFSVAETSPISTLQLPGTITRLDLVHLPLLTFPGGLTIEGMTRVNRIMLSGCPHVDPMSLINGIITSSNIQYVRLPDVNITAPSSILVSLKNSGAKGLDASGSAYEESGQCSGITGRWIMSDLIEDTLLADLAKYYPQLELHNSQFSMITVNDIISGDFCERYSNPENETGADYGNKYVASGHVVAIRKGTHAYKCTFNSKLNQMEGVQLSDENFNYLANGESFDVSDQAGEGFDIFHHLPHFWYKGVNDYKTQKKHYFFSTTEEEPLSTADKRVKAMLSELLYAENTGIYADEAEVGAMIDDSVIATASNTNAYRMDVEGMKQVRWPGMNHARLGAVFTDADGRIVGTFNMQVSHTYFDFTIGNYVFCDVPSGAKWVYFTAFREIGDIECMAVDSAHVEAIEGEWTEHTVGENDSLVGTYPITIDGLKLPRSLSGAVRSRKGTGTSTTSSEWAYDAEGNPTETPVGTINYTAKDFQNSTRRRGPGYQLQDYEQHKEISILWWALSGNTNEQSIVGNGTHNAVLNGRDNIGMADTDYVGNALNSLMGLKHYVGCNSEWMDYIGCNIKDYVSWYKNRCLDNNADDPIDYKAHIYNPVTKTERVVQTVTSNGNCVVRLVHGAKCDILPSKVHQTDTSKYTTHYAAGFWLPGSRGSVVLRSGHYSHAYGGLAYASANVASSVSSAYYGGRLAFRGKFVIVG